MAQFPPIDREGTSFTITISTPIYNNFAFRPDIPPNADPRKIRRRFVEVVEVTTAHAEPRLPLVRRRVVQLRARDPRHLSRQRSRP